MTGILELVLLYADFPDLAGCADDLEEFLATVRRIHDLVAAAVTAHGGVSLSTLGNACCAGFRTADDALTAAQEIHRAVAGVSAVHLGLVGGGAAADPAVRIPLLHRARLLADGGEPDRILLAEEVAAALGGTVCIPLGPRRLPGRSRLERVYTV